MTQLIKDGALAENDWTRVGAEDSIPASGNIIVSLAAWQEQKVSLRNHDGQVAVCLEPGEEPEQIADDLADLPMIAIHFPAFADGRGYSYARELRTRYNYKGEIRAIGDVLQDQLFYLWRCGFNAFDIRADRDATAALKGLTDFTVTYQGDARDPRPVYQRT
ncbi:MAG: oxidoreductase [Gammaproteobacteria bacterium HGW-Gammaproteobacteria-14]|nr:MAG: oxidoreductase [Gammaproteobacteria bacterium HGW-Gammaproteobacteria-14]